MAWPFSKKIETKENPAGASFFVSHPVEWSSWGRNSQSYIDEGYQGNVAVYRSNREIVTAATSIKLELYDDNGNQVDSHAALDLLGNPNPMQSYSEWLTEMLTNRGLFGEMFCVATSEINPVEIWPLMPNDMKVKSSSTGIPQAYEHEKGNARQVFPVNPQTGESICFFSKMYNPKSYWRGQSPLMAAALAADTFNAGQKWNYSLLKNSGRPSGLVRFKGDYPGQEQVQRLREYFKSAIQGSENAGQIPMLSDDAEWVQLSQSARDMDFTETMKMTTKQIAAAYGVPLPLVDNDASTFNNMEMAKEKLYTDTVIPMMNDLLGALNRWLLPMFGLEGHELKLDLDSIPALEGLRQKMFDRAKAGYDSGILTLQESRGMIGFEETPDGDLKQMQPPQLPDDEAKYLAYGLDHG